MISLKKRSKGFTIVELLIVIIVIGILTALVISTYSGIQAKARNATRESDIKDLQAQLTSFYSQSGYYPSLSDLNSANWRTANMKTLDISDLTDPSNSTQSTTLVGAPIAKSYAYAVSTSAGASCESDDSTCAQYTLTATYEGSVNGATTFSKTNLN